MESRRSGTLGWFVTLAILLHALFLSRPAPESLFSPSAKKGADVPIEIARMSDFPIVQTERSEKQSKPKKPRFAGELDQQVEKETRSPRTGRLSSGGRNSTSPGQKAESADEQADESVTAGQPGSPSLRDLMPSASPNSLPDDIALGEQTILETEGVGYASFLNRLAEAIYQPWVDNARAAIGEVYRAGGKMEGHLYITRLQIELDDEGEVVAIQTLKSSGIESLDEAPRRALWDRGPYLNPPKQMRQADGHLRFVYSFHFEWKSSLFNIVPSAI